MAHIFFERLEKRQSTQALYGPSLAGFIQVPQVNRYYSPINPGVNLYPAWGNTAGSGGYSYTSWLNPLGVSPFPYGSLWTGLSQFLSPVRYSNALLFGAGGIGAGSISLAPAPVYTPPVSSITLLYAIFTPIAIPTAVVP